MGWQPSDPEWEVSPAVSGDRHLHVGAEPKRSRLQLWAGFPPFTPLTSARHLGASTHSRDCVSPVSPRVPEGNNSIWMVQKQRPPGKDQLQRNGQGRRCTPRPAAGCG